MLKSLRVSWSVFLRNKFISIMYSLALEIGRAELYESSKSNAEVIGNIYGGIEGEGLLTLP